MYQEILKENFRSNVIRAIFISRSAVGLPEACEIYEKMDDAEREKVFADYMQCGGYIVY